jgi:hypothetical protein
MGRVTNGIIVGLISLPLSKFVTIGRVEQARRRDAHLLADAGTGSVSAVYGRQPIGAGSLFAQRRQLKQECSFIQSATKQLRSMHENKSFGGKLQCQQPEKPQSSNKTRSNFRAAFIVNRFVLKQNPC